MSTLVGGGGSNLAGYVNGVGTASRFQSPAGVASDTLGNLFVADTGNNVIRKVVLSTGE